MRSADAGLPLVGRHRPRELGKIAEELNASWRRNNAETQRGRRRVLSSVTIRSWELNDLAKEPKHFP